MAIMDAIKSQSVTPAWADIGNIDLSKNETPVLKARPRPILDANLYMKKVSPVRALLVMLGMVYDYHQNAHQGAAPPLVFLLPSFDITCKGC